MVITTPGTMCREIPQTPTPNHICYQPAPSSVGDLCTLRRGPSDTAGRRAHRSLNFRLKWPVAIAMLPVRSSHRETYMAKHESTAVNELIDLARTGKRVDEDDGGEMMFRPPTPRTITPAPTPPLPT